MTTGQVARITGVSTQSLHDWSAKGLLEPTVQAEGSGSERAYDFPDLAAVQAIVCARRVGVTHGALAPMVASMRRAVGDGVSTCDDNATLVVVVEGKALVIKCPEFLTHMRKHKASTVVAFDVGAVAEETLVKQTAAMLGKQFPRRRGRPRATTPRKKKPRPEQPQRERKR